MQINLNKLHNVISNGHLMEEIKQLAVCAAFCCWVFSTCRLFAAYKFQTNLAVCFSSIFKWKINLFTAFYWIYAHLTTGSLDTAQREIKCVLTLFMWKMASLLLFFSHSFFGVLECVFTVWHCSTWNQYVCRHAIFIILIIHPIFTLLSGTFFVILLTHFQKFELTIFLACCVSGHGFLCECVCVCVLESFRFGGRMAPHSTGCTHHNGQSKLLQFGFGAIFCTQFEVCT